MKKILGIAAVLLASACAVFAGGAGEAAPADPNVRNVEFWHTMTGVNASAIDALVDEFNNTIGKEEGIHVESIFQGNDNSEKLKTLAQAGDMENFPDAAQIAGAGIPSAYGYDSLVPVEELKDSATIVFKMMLGPAIEKEEPNIRNSNLLLVKAKGEVRLRSEVSLAKSGRILTPISIFLALIAS